MFEHKLYHAYMLGSSISTRSVLYRVQVGSHGKGVRKYVRRKDHLGFLSLQREQS